MTTLLAGCLAPSKKLTKEAPLHTGFADSALVKSVTGPGPLKQCEKCGCYIRAGCRWCALLGVVNTAWQQALMN